MSMTSVARTARGRVPRIAEQAVERARLAVVPRGVARPPRVPFVALVSVLLVGGVAGLLYVNTSMQQASFTTSALQERAQRLDAVQQSLQMQLERLRNPQRVALRARHLGMVPPPAPAFLRLDGHGGGRVLGHPAPAVAGDGIRVSPAPRAKPSNLRPAPVIVEPPQNKDKQNKDKQNSRQDGQARQNQTSQPREKHGAASTQDADRTGTKKPAPHQSHQPH
ncbi:MAG TPA: hypothetical protein VFJ19_15010 [Nocardioidaceae bacterium]|nr:hypothetical protein [Nocardioidaceae bacterium]